MQAQREVMNKEDKGWFLPDVLDIIALLSVHQERIERRIVKLENDFDYVDHAEIRSLRSDVDQIEWRLQGFLDLVREM